MGGCVQTLLALYIVEVHVIHCMYHDSLSSFQLGIWVKLASHSRLCGRGAGAQGSEAVSDAPPWRDPRQVGAHKPWQHRDCITASRSDQPCVGWSRPAGSFCGRQAPVSNVC